MPLHERDIHYFIEATVAYLNKITGNEIVLRDPTIEFQSLVFSACTGLIHLTGNAEGFAYLTVSQQFLQQLHLARHHREPSSEDTSRDAMSEITGNIVQSVRKRFGNELQLSEPRIFSTVPDDPIECHPPFLWYPSCGARNTLTLCSVWRRLKPIPPPYDRH